MMILAVDPGGTTGIALKYFLAATIPDLDAPYTSMPVGFSAAAQELEDLCDRYEPDVIVVEKFTITAATAKKTTAGSNLAIELIGVTKYIAEKQGIQVIEQKPVDAMTFCTDEKLKRLGWYVPGKDHARDALRHLLLAAVRLKAIDLNLLLPRDL